MPDYIQHNAQGLITKRWRSVSPDVVSGLQNIAEISRSELESITEYHVYDNGIREMTQQEKDDYDAWKAQQAADIENARIAGLDDLIEDSGLASITLTKVDTVINNIGDLADAKTFLKKLCRFIIKFIAHSA